MIERLLGMSKVVRSKSWPKYNFLFTFVLFYRGYSIVMFDQQRNGCM